MLGVQPEVALVNEMAYSASMIDHYLEADYKAVIMEWNNPRHAHPEWENGWRYYPQRAKGVTGDSTPLIWADSIAFQKFQRYVHGENDLEKYSEYLKSHAGEETRYFPLYSNDVEIFDYRPGRYHTEADFTGSSEWNRIIELYKYLKEQDWCNLVSPASVLSGLEHAKGGNVLRLESPGQPIPVKKQEKYNINRWALTGRNDQYINSACYRIFTKLSQSKSPVNDPDKKELCYLWCSDFRTHITEKRWEEYLLRLQKFSDKLQVGHPEIKFVSSVSSPRDSSLFNVSTQSNFIHITSSELNLILSMRRGNAIYSFNINRLGSNALFGTLEHGFYDDISFGADFYSGHSIVEPPGEHKSTDLNQVHAVINDDSDGVFVYCNSDINNNTFETQYTLRENSLTLQKRIRLPERKIAAIYPFNFTMNPLAWDKESLVFGVKNGGNALEDYAIGAEHIRHNSIYSGLISSVYGLGATSGELRIRDKDKMLIFEHDLPTGYLIPSITYIPMERGLYFLRIVYSAQEIDETFRPQSSPQVLNFLLTIRWG